ncbi:phosphoribosyltransferase [Nitratifractor sp.]
MIFETRQEAGSRLAELLLEYRDAPDTLIVALPRGGVPVGAAMAEVLHLPLDIFFVKKIPSPYNEEAGIGAVSETGLMHVDNYAAERLGVSEEYLQRRAEEKLRQMQEKRALYGRPRSHYRGKTVILTDDGIATGSSMLLAAEALRREGAAKVIIAVPVAPRELEPILKRVADDVRILHPSDNLIAVGRFYRDFHQLEDAEVLDLLAKTPAP